MSWITGDFQINLSAAYTAPFEDVLETAQEWIGKATIIGGEVELADTVRERLESARTRENTTYTWSNSDRPSFSVPLTFISVGDNDRPQDLAMSLGALTQPGIRGNGTNPTLQPPAGYRASLQDGTRGTFDLELGNWFKASELVLVDAPVTLSAQRMENNQPLYATVDVTLEPYRTISEEELLGYFMVPRGTAVAT